MEYGELVKTGTEYYWHEFSQALADEDRVPLLNGVKPDYWLRERAVKKLLVVAKTECHRVTAELELAKVDSVIASMSKDFKCPPDLHSVVTSLLRSPCYELPGIKLVQLRGRDDAPGRQELTYSPISS